jgi:hypothetical protein
MTTARWNASNGCVRILVVVWAIGLSLPLVAGEIPHSSDDVVLQQLAALDHEGRGELSADDTRALFDLLGRSHLLERPSLPVETIEQVGRLIYRAKADPAAQQTYLDDFPGLWNRIGMDVDPLGLANLDDRVARSEGKPQPYGTLPAAPTDYPAADAQRSYIFARDMLGVPANAPAAPNETPLPLAMRPAQKPTLPTVRAEALRLGALDQSVRAWPGNPSPEESKVLIKRMEVVDAETEPRIKAMFRNYGIPRPAQVGRAATHSAYLVIQHAINDPGLMRAALSQAKWMAARGELPAIDYALLSDRVDCVIDHRPQQFGTQGSRDPSSHWYCPIADAQHVNERRAGLHLAALTDKAIYGTVGKPGS